MRHRIAGNSLGRFSSLRKATVRDLAKATLIHQKIETTKARAKEARKLVEKLITLGKKNTLPAKRKAFSILCDHMLVSNLFNKIAVRFNSRNGGYTRVIPLSFRRGDNAHLVYLELTEKEIIEPKKPVATTAKSKTPDAGTPSQGETPKEVKKPEPRAAHPPQKEVPGKDKGKSKNIGGGIKRLFTKKPSE